MQRNKNGNLYLFIDRLSVELPVDGKVFLHLSFLNKESDIYPIKSSKNKYIFNKMLKIPATYSIDSSSGTVEKCFFTLRLITETSDGLKHPFAGLLKRLEDTYNSNHMVLQYSQMVTKLSNIPVLIFACILQDLSQPFPNDFKYIHLRNSIQNHQNDKTFEYSPNKPLFSPDYIVELNSTDSYINSFLLNASDEDDIDYNQAYHPKSNTKNESSNIQSQDKINDLNLLLDTSFSENLSENSLSFEQYLLQLFLHVDIYDFAAPASILIHYIDKNKIENLNNTFSEIYSIINTLQANSNSLQNSIRFYASAVFLHKIFNQEWTEKLVRNCEKTAIRKGKNILYYHFASMFRSTKINEHRKQFINYYQSFNSSFAKFILNLIIEEIDITVTNDILDRGISTFGRAVEFNGILTNFETLINIQFPRFHQCLLTIISCQTILDHPKYCLTIAPLLSPTFVYSILIGIQQDEHFQGVDYGKIKNFELSMKIDLTQGKETIRLYRKLKDIPFNLIPQ